VLQLAQVLLPQFLAAKVVAVHASRAVADDDALAVGRRRRGAERVGVVRRFLLGIGHVLLPEHFPVGAAQAPERSRVRGSRTAAWRSRRPVLLVGRLRQEDAVAPDDGRRVALVRQRHFPLHVFLVTPGQRQVGLGGVPLVVGAAPVRPVAGQQGG